MANQPDGQMSGLLNVLSYICWIFSRRNEKLRQPIADLCLGVGNIMKCKQLKLQKLPQSYYHELIDNTYVETLPGDERTCAIIADTLFNEIFNPNCDYGWIEAKQSPVSGTKRFIQCLKSHEKFLNKCVIYVTEETGFNITQMLQLSEDKVMCNVVNCDPNFYPVFAEGIKIAPVSSPFDLDPEDESNALCEFFSSPKYLIEGDLFCVSLAEYLPMIEYYPSYCSQPQFWFKVIEITSKTKQSKGLGYFILKDKCELYSVPPVPSYLPPKTEKYVNKKLISMIPDELEKNFQLIKKLFKPFFNEIDIPALFLLTGAPGSGRKTCLKSIALYFGLQIIYFDCYDFQNLGVAAAESKYDYLFSKLLKIGPCILCMTNFQLLGKDRGNKEDPRLINSFFTQAQNVFKNASYPVFLIGISNTTEMSPVVLRSFLKTIHFPTVTEIVGTLQWIVNDLELNTSESCLNEIKSRLVGYQFADLKLLVRHAKRILHQDNPHSIHLNFECFQQAVEIMEAAYSDAIGAAKVPNVRWNDVGGLASLKEEIITTLQPELFNSDLKRSGILFYGPPGTGKTLMAKALATECGMTFLSVKGPELMNMYVGQSERNVREVFQRGREAAPCILFFDELDSLAPNRGGGGSGGGGGVTDRVVSQLLAEMDGLVANTGLFVVAATNRPDLVDAALLRPGRFDRMWYLGPCTGAQERLSVLLALTKKFTLEKDVNLEEVANVLPEDVTGADIYSFCSNAWLNSARRHISAEESNIAIPLKVSNEDFKVALNNLVPSLSNDDLMYYQKMARNISTR